MREAPATAHRNATITEAKIEFENVAKADWPREEAGLSTKKKSRTAVLSY